MVAQVKLLVEIVKHVARHDEFDHCQRILVVGRGWKAEKGDIERRRSGAFLTDENGCFAQIAVAGERQLVEGDDEQRNEKQDEEQDSIGGDLEHTGSVND